MKLGPEVLGDTTAPMHKLFFCTSELIGLITLKVLGFADLHLRDQEHPLMARKVPNL